jgi:hypothetical protein
MRATQLLLASLSLACPSLAAGVQARAAEYTFTTYGLGGMAFGAGITPPAGTYVSTGASFYRGSISGISFPIRLSAVRRAGTFCSGSGTS